jgi:hypothetical protein
VSHLPHLLAFALVDELAAARQWRALFRFAASGFRDFTRIAGSQPGNVARYLRWPTGRPCLPNSMSIWPTAALCARTAVGRDGDAC